MNIKELARAVEAISIEFATGDEEITCTTGIEEGLPGAVSFIGNPLYERHLATTKATAVIVSEYLQAPYAQGGGPALLRVKKPHEGFAKALELFSQKRERPAIGIHPSAVVDTSAMIHPEASIGANAFIGARSSVGARTIVAPGVHIGPDTVIGEDCEIHPNAVIYDRMRLGNRVVVGPGAVVGFDGFGYVNMSDGSYRKVPQVGIVVLEDDVELGANTTVDRATVSETRVKKGVKLDNMVQIAHNVTVGEHSVMAAQSGISGSTTLGRMNIVGGQAGITGHISTVDHVIIGAQSGVSKSITKPGLYMGYPARSGREVLKLEGATRTLPDLIERVKRLEEQLEELRIKE